ncbi:MAG TPA: hypothetical protein DEF30_08175 [Proteiniclasticum sp.]|uniref:hypothetical protein n=1 Tax=Proteiniclasticum sp. TaxID=2053595 RepID=UPI000E9A0E96|nr:hypothetical protein [Proteiniclasticum sp.]HBW13777.1 hypothetical protein [Proteiniclasticum sp.]
MRVYFSPIFVFTEGFENITYSFENRIVTATYKGKKETFDFRGLPDGIVQEIEAEILEFNPITHSEIVDGILYLEVMNFIRENATEFEKFPNWIEV